MYWLNVLKLDPLLAKLNLYGVSAKHLTDYVTSDKDLIRNINRKPTSYFLMNN